MDRELAALQHGWYKYVKLNPDNCCVPVRA